MICRQNAAFLCKDEQTQTLLYLFFSVFNFQNEWLCDCNPSSLRAAVREYWFWLFLETYTDCGDCRLYKEARVCRELCGCVVVVRPGVRSLTVIAPRCTLHHQWRQASTTRHEYSTDLSSWPAVPPTTCRLDVRRRAVTAPDTPTATSWLTAACPAVHEPTRPSDVLDCPPRNSRRSRSKLPPVSTARRSPGSGSQWLTEVVVGDTRLAAATLSGRGALTSVGDGDGVGDGDRDECRWRAGRCTEIRPEFKTANK